MGIIRTATSKDIKYNLVSVPVALTKVFLNLTDVFHAFSSVVRQMPE